MSQEVGFNKKFLISWYLAGLGVGIACLIATLSEGSSVNLSDLPLFFLVFPAVVIGFGVIGILAEASNIQWNFKGVKHQSFY